MEKAGIRDDRWWAGWIAAGIVATVLIGFGRSFYLAPLFAESPIWASPEPLFYFHGGVFSLWFVLLAVQTWLIRDRSFASHRKLGWAGAAIAGAIVLVGIHISLRAANRPGGFTDVPVPPEQFLLVPMLDMATFTGFVAMGIVRRKRAASHKRWMLLASITLLGAPVARLPYQLPWLPQAIDLWTYAVFIAALAAWDFTTRRRLSTETLCGAILIVGLKAFVGPLSALPAWTGVARWMIGFAGPP